MKPIRLRHLSLVIFLVLLAWAPTARATDLTFGGQVGSLSAVSGKSDTGLGYGAFVQASALDLLTLQVDYFASRINDASVQGFAPDIMFHLIKSDAFRLGLLAGPGFYKEGTDKWRFGLNGGAFGEVSFIPKLPIGLQLRYHSVFSGSKNDLWSIFMTVGFRFNVLGGGDDW